MKFDDYTLRLVFANLIDNAIKYSKTRGITIHLKKDEDENPVVIVEDTGIGISEECRSKMRKY